METFFVIKNWSKTSTKLEKLKKKIRVELSSFSFSSSHEFYSIHKGTILTPNHSTEPLYNLQNTLSALNKIIAVGWFLLFNISLYIYISYQ